MVFVLVAGLSLWPNLGLVPDTKAQEVSTAPVILGDRSFRNEVDQAIDRGLAWLKTNQNAEGYWSTPEQPAVTALALMAFADTPDANEGTTKPAHLHKGYDFILSAVQPDGGIHKGKLVTYNTALSMMALLAAENPAYNPMILKAREYLVGLQVDFGTKGKLDTPYDGGIGYGTKYEHSDMGNTLQALEALYYSRHLRKEENAAAPDLNWQAAIHFLQSCQNLPGSNKEAWASDDPENKGGFIYYPGHSMAGSTTNSATGRVALRSYGSISYGGLLSYIYADLKKNDPRVLAVLDWLRGNYTLEENPGMGPQGLFYYYHTMAKALSAYGVKQLQLADGKSVNWSKELAMQLINRQKPDGSWLNDEHARWWEKDPALVTAYAVLTLERLRDQL